MALDDEVLDDEEFDVELVDDFALESDEEDDEDEAGVAGVEPPSEDAAAPALALPSETSDLLSVR